MSDDERIARLTELARRVWPCVRTTWMGGSEEENVLVELPGAVITPSGHVLIDTGTHPQATDALEAALLALLRDEPSLERAFREMEAAKGYLPTWVEQLAAEWETEATALKVACTDDSTGELVMSPDEHGLLRTLEEHAAELRARAKGGEHG